MKEVEVLNSDELLIALSGEIDSENADEFYEEVMKFYKAGGITFECSALQFIDSTTLGTFVKILKHVKQNGGAIRLTALSPRLKKLFVICALDRIMEIES